MGMTLLKGGYILYTSGFYKDMLERALATFFQAFLALVGSDMVGVTDFNWGAALSVAAMAAIVSVAKSFVAGATSPETGASFGTAVPRDASAAIEDNEYAGRYEAGPAAPVAEGTPVDVVPEGEEYPLNH